MDSNFKDLVVWERAQRLTLVVYKMTEWFPNEPRFGIKSQLRLTVLNIPSSIAKGWEMREDPDLAIPCIKTACIAVEQVKTSLLAARELHLLDEFAYKLVTQRATELHPLLTNLIQRIETGL